MSIKEIPTNFRVYYKAMRTAIQPKYEKAVDSYEKLLVDEKALYEDIKSKLDIYKANYNVKLTDYDEFIDNRYSTGEFYAHAKGLFVNKKNNYKATTSLYNLYKLAKQQKELRDTKHQIDVWEKMLDLTIDEYKGVLEKFYNEVTRQLIVEGKGYAFEQPLGWICINRCKVVQGKRRLLDFKATRENKAKLVSEGKRLWNKEEAAYATQVGIDYQGVDYRVFKNEEYVYEFALINCRIVKEEKMEFKVTDSHRLFNTGKTEEDFIAECNGDLNKICSLKCNPRRKLFMCLKANDILYLNFIRNEGQQSVKTPKANRKNRQ